MSLSRLARRVCGACCTPTDPNLELLGTLGLTEVAPGAGFVTAVGCHDCGGTGYHGRVPLFEVMTMTDEIALLSGHPRARSS